MAIFSNDYIVALDDAAIAETIHKVVELNARYKPTRQTVLQTPFGQGQLTDQEWIIIDQIPSAKAFAAPHAHYKAQLPDWHTTQPKTVAHSFTYVKEMWTKEDLTSNFVRPAGMTKVTTLSQANQLAMANFNIKLALAEDAMLTRFELDSVSALIYGYLSPNPRFGINTYTDYFKTWQTTEADVIAKTDSAELTNIDFSTLNANGGVGKRCWDTTGGTENARHPVKDVLNFCRSYQTRHGVYPPQIITDRATAELLCKDWYTNYAKPGSTLQNQLKFRSPDRIIEGIAQYQGLELALELPILNLEGSSNGTFVPVFTYTAFYHKRKYEDANQTRTEIFPKGWILLMPLPEKCVKYYGALPFAFTGFSATERLAIIKTDPASQEIETGELHSKPYLGFSDPHAAMAFKVTTAT